MRPSSATLSILAAVPLILTACSDGRLPTAPHSATARGARAARNPNAATLTILLAPGAAATFPTDINNQGVIVGRYMSAGRTHGFVLDAAGSYTTIDFPGSSFTVVGAISDSGAILGWYSLPTAPSVRHGFLLKDGTFTTIDPPGSTFTNALGIDNRGDVSGRFCTLAVCHPSSSDIHGFLLRDGEYTTLDAPNGSGTTGYKLEPSGTMVGGFAAPTGLEELFLYRNGEFTTFALPNGKTVARDNGGINARGDIVGTFCDGAPPCLNLLTGTHGFLLSGGQLDTIDVLGAAATEATGINARGDIVGAWVTANGQFRGYLLSMHGQAP